MLKEWKQLTKNKAYLISFVCLFVLTLIFLKLCSIFLLFNETRTGGYLLDDYLLRIVPARDISQPLFIINWIGITTGMIMCVRTPKRAMALFVAVIAMIALRSATMYLVPLMPPEGIIPLRDCFLESSFYGDQVLLRDLFFSGHTASMAILFFLVDIKPIKYLLGLITFIIGYLLLVQHVHYTVDIIAAPFFAYIAAYLGTKGADYIHKKVNSDQKLEAVLT